jgi:hypothetical protein
LLCLWGRQRSGISSRFQFEQLYEFYRWHLPVWSIGGICSLLTLQGQKMYLLIYLWGAQHFEDNQCFKIIIEHIHYERKLKATLSRNCLLDSWIISSSVKTVKKLFTQCIWTDWEMAYIQTLLHTIFKDWLNIVLSLWP